MNENIHNQIPTSEEDKLNRVHFSQKYFELMYTYIRKYHKDNKDYKLNDLSLIFAITGKWGEGKTTIVNFMKEYSDKDKVMFIDYNMDLSNKGNNIIQDNILNTIGKEFEGDNNKDLSELLHRYRSVLIRKYTLIIFLWDLFGKKLYPVFKNIPILKNIIRPYNKDLIKKEIIERINNKYIKKGKEIIVIIDDIDRMFQDEIVMTIKMLKSELDLPITYLLLYDEDIVIKALDTKTNQKGKEFLEKFIQKSESIIIKRDQIFNWLMDEIRQLSYKDRKDNNSEEFENRIYEDTKTIEISLGFFKDDFNNIRMCKSFLREIEFFYIPRVLSVNFHDVVIILFFKIYYINLYNILRSFDRKIKDSNKLEKVYGKEKLIFFSSFLKNVLGILDFFLFNNHEDYVMQRDIEDNMSSQEIKNHKENMDSNKYNKEINHDMYFELEDFVKEKDVKKFLDILKSKEELSKLEKILKEYNDKKRLWLFINSVKCKIRNRNLNQNEEIKLFLLKIKEFVFNKVNNSQFGYADIERLVRESYAVINKKTEFDINEIKNILGIKFYKDKSMLQVTSVLFLFLIWKEFFIRYSNIYSENITIKYSKNITVKEYGEKKKDGRTYFKNLIIQDINRVNKTMNLEEKLIINVMIEYNNTFPYDEINNFEEILEDKNQLIKLIYLCKERRFYDILSLFYIDNAFCGANSLKEMIPIWMSGKDIQQIKTGKDSSSKISSLVLILKK